MDNMIKQWDVLFPYQSHRDSEQEIHGLLYKELLKLKNNTCIAARGMWWLKEIEKLTIPIITITIVGDKKFVIENLKKRNESEIDYLENIDQVNTNIGNYLNQAYNTQIVVNNIEWILDATVEKIKTLIDSYISATVGEHTQKVLWPIRMWLTGMMMWDINDVEMENIIYNTLTNTIGEVNESNVQLLVNGMYTAKNSRLPAIMQRLLTPTYHKVNSEIQDHEQEIRKKVYTIVAQVLNNVGKTEEAKEVLLQMGLKVDILDVSRTVSLDKKESCHSMINKEIEEINNQKTWDYHNVYIHNWTLNISYDFAFWENARNKIREEYGKLLKYKDIEIIETIWNRRGIITAKIYNHPSIHYVKIHVVKDKP